VLGYQRAHGTHYILEGTQVATFVASGEFIPAVETHDQDQHEYSPEYISIMEYLRSRSDVEEVLEGMHTFIDSNVGLCSQHLARVPGQSFVPVVYVQAIPRVVITGKEYKGFS